MNKRKLLKANYHRYWWSQRHRTCDHLTHSTITRSRGSKWLINTSLISLCRLVARAHDINFIVLFMRKFKFSVFFRPEFKYFAIEDTVGIWFSVFGTRFCKVISGPSCFFLVEKTAKKLIRSNVVRDAQLVYRSQIHSNVNIQIFDDKKSFSF